MNGNQDDRPDFYTIFSANSVVVQIPDTNDNSANAERTTDQRGKYKVHWITHSRKKLDTGKYMLINWHFFDEDAEPGDLVLCDLLVRVKETDFGPVPAVFLTPCAEGMLPRMILIAEYRIRTDIVFFMAEGALLKLNPLSTTRQAESLENQILDQFEDEYDEKNADEPNHSNKQNKSSTSDTRTPINILKFKEQIAKDAEAAPNEKNNFDEFVD